MSEAGIVWSGSECTVKVFLSNGAGQYDINSPVFEYCYYQNCVVRAALNTSRRQVTGRPHGKIVNDDYEYSMSVDHFYVKKDRELDLTTVFSPRQPLVIDMILSHPHEGPDEAEHHILKIAYATSLSISSSDNQNVTGSVEFDAEEFE